MCVCVLHLYVCVTYIRSTEISKEHWQKITSEQFGLHVKITAENQKDFNTQKNTFCEHIHFMHDNVPMEMLFHDNTEIK